MGAPPEVRSTIEDALAPAMAAASGLRWTRPAGWHLTLAFLGTVPDAGAVADVLAEVARASTSFEVVTGASGRFGDRVLWVGVDDADGRLVALAGTVRTALMEAGVPVQDADRPLRAHLTVARSGRRRVRDADVRRLVVPRMPWPVARVGLWSSPGGGRYEVDASVPLAPAT